MHGGFGTGMRAPGAFEIAFTDNPGLKPERTRSLEGGVETGWLDGRLVADVLYFRNDYDDLIVTVGLVTGTTSYRSDNVSNALSEGVEASVSFRPVAALTVRGGLIGQRTEILANDGRPGAPTPFEVGDPLLRRPELAGFVDVAGHRRTRERLPTGRQPRRVQATSTPASAPTPASSSTRATPRPTPVSRSACSIRSKSSAACSTCSTSSTKKSTASPRSDAA